MTYKNKRTFSNSLQALGLSQHFFSTVCTHSSIEPEEDQMPHLDSWASHILMEDYTSSNGKAATVECLLWKLESVITPYCRMSFHSMQFFFQPTINPLSLCLSLLFSYKYIHDLNINIYKIMWVLMKIHNVKYLWQE